MLTKNKEEERFFQYLDFLPTPALIGKESKDRKNGKTFFVNKAFIETIGYDIEDIPDHLSFMSLAYPELSYRREVMRDWFEKTAQLDEDKTSLVQLCSKVFCKDQQYRWFEVRTELKSTIGDGVVIVLFNNIDKAKSQALEFEELSHKDPLTKLANRRHLLQLLTQEKDNLKDNVLRNNSFSLVMADIDLFKNINDNFGHSCGDFVIETVAKIIKQSTRKVDVIARWGGEEFLFLLPKTNVTEARIVVKKIMKRIHEYQFEWEGQAFKISLTYGITGYQAQEDTSDTIKRADKYLYRGKELGRGCLVADDLFEAWGT